VPHSSCSGEQSLAAAGPTRYSSASLPIHRATPVPSTVGEGTVTALSHTQARADWTASAGQLRGTLSALLTTLGADTTNAEH
jgi:hypothetical protein